MTDENSKFQTNDAQTIIAFYRVVEHVTTFGKDENKNEPFTWVEEFKGNDLIKCKNLAIEYYNKRIEGLDNGKYFLPFASPKDFEFGKNAAYSINLEFVYYFPLDEDNIEYVCDISIGDEESLENEASILSLIYGE